MLAKRLRRWETPFGEPYAARGTGIEVDSFAPPGYKRPSAFDLQHGGGLVDVNFFMIVGFALAAYSIVANDAIQTLGTFLASNGSRPWWLLWGYSCSILVAVLVYGWFANGGDPAYGRLAKFPPPEGGITWLHAVPPLMLLVLTRFGIPVSTTFLVLTTFAPGNLGKMLTKSLLGYAVAFVIGFTIYVAISNLLRSWLTEACPPKRRPIWIGLQWSATAFLWSQWLIQDLANIFVYLPRELPGNGIFLATAFMIVLHAMIFYRRGGEIQRIVTSKSDTADIRSASVIDFIYGWILLVFKELSNIPMSTTWVFLGLLAGRELAINWRMKNRPTSEVRRMLLLDAGKAGAGLAISVILALGLPRIDAAVRGATGSSNDNATAVEQPAVMPASVGGELLDDDDAEVILEGGDIE